MPDITTEAGWRDPPSPRRGRPARAGRRWWELLISERLAAIFGLWLAVALIYWPSSAALNGIWRGASGDAYTQGYLVLMSSLWLLWRDRDRLKMKPVSPVGWAWVPVVMLSAAWLWSWRASIQVLHVLLLPAILLSALVAALGWRVARSCLVPVGLLIFAMPVWGAINHSLQMLSAKLNGVLIWFAGMPAYMQGAMIQLPGGSIEIAHACTGLNGLLVALTLATLYGEIARDPLLRRLVWAVLLGVLSVISNSVRIFIVTVAAYDTDMRSPLVRHHIWLGWCLFAVAVAVFFVLASYLARYWDRGRLPEAREAPAGLVENADVPRSPIRMRVVQIAVALACLGLLPALSYGMDAMRSTSPSAVVVQWPDAPQGWRGPMPDAETEWSPRFENPSAESLQLYVDPRAKPVEVFTVAYRQQTQDGKLLGYRNDLLGSTKQLQARSQGVVDSPVGRWRETVAVDATGARSLIWWRYRIGSRVFIGPRLSQAWYGLKALTGSPPVSSLTALRATCSASCGAAREQLAAAASRLQPVMSVRP